MEILEKGALPDGTHVQLESWDGEPMIGAYPKAVRDLFFAWRDGTCRLSLTRFSSMEEARVIYAALTDGKLGLDSLKAHFWNGDRDEYVLGMADTFAGMDSRRLATF